MKLTLMNSSIVGREENSFLFARIIEVRKKKKRGIFSSHFPHFFLSDETIKVQVDLVLCGLFYLRIRVSAIANWPFFWKVSPNLQSFLVFLYANLLYASLIFRSLSIAYNEVQLYSHPNVKKGWQNKEKRTCFSVFSGFILTLQYHQNIPVEKHWNMHFKKGRRKKESKYSKKRFITDKHLS
jgi:hypothetical protein